MKNKTCKSSVLKLPACNDVPREGKRKHLSIILSHYVTTKTITAREKKFVLEAFDLNLYAYNMESFDRWSGLRMEIGFYGIKKEVLPYKPKKAKHYKL